MTDLIFGAPRAELLAASISIKKYIEEYNELNGNIKRFMPKKMKVRRWKPTELNSPFPNPQHPILEARAEVSTFKNP